jgi:hypothetical protein
MRVIPVLLLAATLVRVACPLVSVQAQHRPADKTGAPVDDEDKGKENLLGRLAEVQKDGRTGAQVARDNALIRAADTGDAARVRRALAGGAGVNARYIDADAFLSAGMTGYTALMLAGAGGHADVVKVLIEHKADLDAERKGRTALYLATTRGHDGVTRLLVAAGAKGDPKKIRLTRDLIRAACKGYRMEPGEPFPPIPGAPRDLDEAPDLKDVLRRGADVNAADPDGHTALMYAANLGLADNVRALLAAGADPARTATSGETALSLAEREDRLFRPAARRAAADLLRPHVGKKK